MWGVVEFGGLGFGDGLGFGLVVVWRGLVWLGFGGGLVGVGVWCGLGFGGGLVVVRGLVVVGVWRGLAVVWGLAWFGVWRGSLTVCWELAVGAGGSWWSLGGWWCVLGGLDGVVEVHWWSEVC